MKNRKNFNVNLQELINEGFINSDEIIYHTWFRGKKKGNIVEAKILKNGNIFLLKEKIEYSSLTEAASHFTGNSVNGWIWWYHNHEGKGRDIKITTMNDIRKKYLESIS